MVANEASSWAKKRMFCDLIPTSIEGSPQTMLASSDRYRILPYWFLVLTSGLLAMTCRTRWSWQFNLRSLFILTTFLAHRAEDNRLAGPLVDWEVTQVSTSPVPGAGCRCQTAVFGLWYAVQ